MAGAVELSVTETDGSGAGAASGGSSGSGQGECNCKKPKRRHICKFICRKRVDWVSLGAGSGWTDATVPDGPQCRSQHIPSAVIKACTTIQVPGVITAEGIRQPQQRLDGAGAAVGAGYCALEESLV
ncbi:hypothetical protein H4R27_004513 [Coemansia aciculifera]|nr:hypothetical protein H4R27_004513 [Coemansia aciculifera]